MKKSHKAKIKERIFSYLFDFIFYFVLAFLFYILIYLLPDPNASKPDMAAPAETIMPTFKPKGGIITFLIGCFVSLFVTPALIGFAELFFGTSPGKWMVGLKIERTDLSTSPFVCRLLRFLMKYAGFILLALAPLYDLFLEGVFPYFIFGWHIREIFTIFVVTAFGFSIFSWFFCLRDSRQTLYDQLSGTVVYKNR